MYWLPKMHKTPTGARFAVASRKCSTKGFQSQCKIFKLIFKQIQSFLEKSHFSTDYKNLGVVQNSKPVIDRLDQINAKQNTNLISTFDFSTIYIKLPQKNLLMVLFHLIDFGFNRGSKRKDRFFLKNCVLTFFH